MENVVIRRATEKDQPQILALARGERLKPTGLDWPKFVVADYDGKVVGAVQLRKHPEGSQELGSRVVAREFRRQGLAARLIEKRLAQTTGRMLVITGGAYADYYRRWGFREIKPRHAPLFVCANYWLGYLGGGLISLFRGRSINHLAVLERAG